jgi:hypothetical protein
MLQDLAALAPPLIMCVAFLVGVGALVRRELAPRRRARAAAADGPGKATGGSLPGADGLGRAETNPDRGDASQT